MKQCVGIENMIETACEVFDIESKAISDLKGKLNSDFEKAVELLFRSKGRVIVTGMGKSGLIGKKIAATLSSTGTPSYFLHPAESTHGDSGIVTRDDVVIAISNSGETAELLNLLPLLKRFGVSIVSMSGNKSSTLVSHSDCFLDISVEREACPLGKAPTASTTATLAMGDALSVCLLKKRGFTEQDFLLFHPSGSLGKGILWSVQELMIQGDRLPIAAEDSDFRSAITFINEKKLGCAILVDDNGKMTGILTDGDIRRAVLQSVDVASLKAKDVMTKNPKTIAPKDLAAKALQIMEKFSITSLAVVDIEGRPIGLVHIHDLLKAGVA